MLTSLCLEDGGACSGCCHRPNGGRLRRFRRSLSVGDLQKICFLHPMKIATLSSYWLRTTHELPAIIGARLRRGVENWIQSAIAQHYERINLVLYSSPSNDGLHFLFFITPASVALVQASFSRRMAFRAQIWPGICFKIPGARLMRAEPVGCRRIGRVPIRLH